MTATLFWFLLGLVLIVRGGDLFVTASVRLAELLQVPRVVIGSTLVSLATTSPELVVSTLASLRGEPGLAVGNAVGSSICNLALIIGLLAVITPFCAKDRQPLPSMVAMILLGLLAFGVSVDGVIGPGEGAVLLVAATMFLGWSLQRAWKQKSRQKFDKQPVPAPGPGWMPVTVRFSIGAIMVLLGSRFLVDSAVDFASALGVSPILIGLTVVAVGTSLPEVVTAISAATKGVSDLSFGNIFGANILNLGLIVGLSAMIHPVTLTPFTLYFNFPVMLAVAMTVVFIYFRSARFSRRSGIFLLAFYAGYVGVLFAFSHLA